MNAQTQTAQPTQTPDASPHYGRVAVAGKIRSLRKMPGEAGGFVTLIVMPALDEFTQPPVVEVMSPKQLGEVGVLWRGWCALTGYPRKYTVDTTNRQTGESVKETRYTADNILTAIG